MSEEGIPNSVSDFIARHIQSIEQLEILLLLFNAKQSAWSVSDIFQRIQSSPASIRERLNLLVKGGFLVEATPGCFRFEPAVEEMRKTIEQLAENYSYRRVRVIEAIYSKTTDPIKSFANAFQFKRKE